MRPIMIAVLLASVLPFIQPPQASASTQCWNWWSCERDPGGDDWRDAQRRDDYATELRDELRELRQDLRRRDLGEFRDDLEELLDDLRRSDRREVRDEVRAIRRALRQGDMEELREAFRDLRQELADETRGARSNNRRRDRLSGASTCPEGWRLASSTFNAITCVRH